MTVITMSRNELTRLRVLIDSGRGETSSAASATHSLAQRGVAPIKWTL
jgi:hypothetical protein